MVRISDLVKKGMAIEGQPPRPYNEEPSPVSGIPSPASSPDEGVYSPTPRIGGEEFINPNGFEKALQGHQVLREIFRLSTAPFYIKGGEKVLDSRNVLDEHINRMVMDVVYDTDNYIRTVFEYPEEEYKRHTLIEHSINVSIMAIVVGKEIGLSNEELHLLGRAALFHDMGMFVLNGNIFNKSATLSLRDRKLINIHPIEGNNILKSEYRDDKYPQTVALQEHEREDGSGYPYRLRGEEISEFSRIVGICDTVESLTHWRAYRKASPLFQVIRALLMREKSLFTDYIWKSLLRGLTFYPPGTKVILSNDANAKVLKINPNSLIKPVIEFLNRGQDEKRGGRQADLQQTPHLFIKVTIIDY